MKDSVRKEIEALRQKYSPCDTFDNFVLEIDWNSISEKIQLSEDFIREFSGRVNWYWISICQKLSYDFIKEFIHRVDFHKIMEHQRCMQ